MPKLPKFEDWQAPWEKKGEEFNAETAKKFIHDLLSKAEARDDELKAERKKARDAETAQADLQAQLDAKVAGEDGEAERLARELAAANKKLEERDKAERERKAKALDVALDIEGITAKQAKAIAPLLQGDNEDELAESAEKLIESLGLTIGEKPADNDDEDNDEADRLRQRGRRDLRNGSDPDPATPPMPKADFATVNELIPM
ncbi:MAG TPA: hypothetical protein VFX41_07860 [Actinomycetales bacterium]|nr:hypothetical protein [Actinomycetales bacterium]